MLFNLDIDKLLTFIPSLASLELLKVRVRVIVLVIIMIKNTIIMICRMNFNVAGIFKLFTEESYSLNTEITLDELEFVEV